MLTIADHDRLYWKYEYDTTARHVIPLMRRWGIVPDGKMLLDVGCGDGGNICALADAGFRCKGFDLDQRRIELAGMMKENRPCEFFTGDLGSDPPPLRGETFDLVFLHDVFEHLERKQEMLLRLGEYLAPEGRLIITFPPYYSAFGAHQQLLNSIAGRIPFIHLVPGFSETMLPRLVGEPKVFVDEIRKLARLRMGIGAFEAVVHDAGFRIRASKGYFISPNHIRFGLRPVGGGMLGKIPGVREIIISGVIYLLSK